jgi:hypothetical protein
LGPGIKLYRWQFPALGLNFFLSSLLQGTQCTFGNGDLKPGPFFSGRILFENGALNDVINLYPGNRLIKRKLKKPGLYIGLF